ncbi:MAG: hypothetical protein WAY02_08100 [Burkholderiaceae bacterium]
MALLGTAAMLLWYNIIEEQIAEHDDWHTREHFPERLGIPGFKRAQRWVSNSGQRRYFVMYEVSDIDVLSSAPYLERLNHPSPWTSQTMSYFRGMTRGFCQVKQSHGTVLGTTALVVRFSPGPGRENQLQQWLVNDFIPDILQRKGFCNASLFQSDGAPAMTAEQSIRGRDASVDWVLLVTSYCVDSANNLSRAELSGEALMSHGADTGVISDVYQLACSSTEPAILKGSS